MKIDLRHQHRATSSPRHVSDLADGVVSVGGADLVVTVNLDMQSLAGVDTGTPPRNGRTALRASSSSPAPRQGRDDGPNRDRPAGSSAPRRALAEPGAGGRTRPHGGALGCLIVTMLLGEVREAAEIDKSKAPFKTRWRRTALRHCQQHDSPGYLIPERRQRAAQSGRPRGPSHTPRSRRPRRGPH